MLRRRWTLVLAVMLAAQWSAAFAHCRQLADAAAAFGSAICVAHGDGPGTDSTRHDHAASAGLECPACHQLPGVAAVDGPVVRTGVRWAVDATSGVAVAADPPPAPALPYAAQAPPFG